MKVVIGCDHGAFELKEMIKKFLEESEGFEVKDVGIFAKESADYPDIAEKVCKEIVSGEAERGIVMCGTGIGISIASNKIHGIRCALCHNAYTAKMCREHNDANVLALGGRVTDFETAKEIVKIYLETKFSGGRHERRVNKIMALEKK